MGMADNREIERPRVHILITYFNSISYKGRPLIFTCP